MLGSNIPPYILVFLFYNCICKECIKLNYNSLKCFRFQFECFECFREEMWQIGNNDQVVTIREYLWYCDAPGVEVDWKMTRLGLPQLHPLENVSHHLLRLAQLGGVTVLVITEDGNTQTKTKMNPDLMLPPRLHHC